MKDRIVTTDGITVKEKTLVWAISKTKTRLNPIRDYAMTFNQDFLTFSTKHACQDYIDKMNTPVVFTTHDGVDMRVGDKYWYAYKNDSNSLAKGNVLSSLGSAYYTSDVSRVYFSTREKAQEYMDSLKPVESVVIEPVKSELEIAHDKLTALCAKYRNDGLTVQINTTSRFPQNIIRYSVVLIHKSGVPCYDNQYSLLEEAVTTAHAWLINHQS